MTVQVIKQGDKPERAVVKLADAAGISVPYLSQLEAGKRKGSLEVYSAIARVLGMTFDDIA